MVDLSKRTMVNIRQTSPVALGLKAVFLVTTIVGLSRVVGRPSLPTLARRVLVTLNAPRLPPAPPGADQADEK